MRDCSKARNCGYGPGRMCKPGRYVMADGKLTLVGSTYVGIDGAFHRIGRATKAAATKPADKARRRDSKGFISESMGVSLGQMDEMNRMCAEKGIGGVKFVPHPRHGETAVPVMADRNAKFALMKARGLRDADEVRG